MITLPPPPQSENVASKVYLTSDGLSLYLISRRKQKRTESSTGNEPSTTDEFVVDTYALRAWDELVFVKTVKLGSVLGPSSKGNYDNLFLSDFESW